jgi:hypothetical protein
MVNNNYKPTNKEIAKEFISDIGYKISSATKNIVCETAMGLTDFTIGLVGASMFPYVLPTTIATTDIQGSMNRGSSSFNAGAVLGFVGYFGQVYGCSEYMGNTGSLLPIQLMLATNLISGVYEIRRHYRNKLIRENNSLLTTAKELSDILESKFED